MILKRLIPILLAVPLLAACPSGNPNGKMPVDVSKLPRQIYSGEQGPFHVQGIAVDLDRGYMYFSFTTTLLKTNMQGNLLGSVEGMTGHLGCMTLNPDDGRLYASIEYKHDAIGKGILNKLEGVRNDEQTGFYVAVFDVDRIDRIGMNAEKDDVMKTVYIKEAVDDYYAKVSNNGQELEHRFGCSGIDGVTFAPAFGQSRDGKKYLYVAYGIYGDTLRTDNDYLNAQAAAACQNARWAEDDLVIEARYIAQLPAAIAPRAVRRLLEMMGDGSTNCSAAHLKAVVELARGDDPSAVVFLPGGRLAQRVYRELLLTTQSDPLPPFLPTPLALDGETEVEGTPWRVRCRPVRCPDESERKPGALYLAQGALEGPLVLRPRQTGDAVTLPGRGGTKTLKKLFIDEKVPRRERERIPVLADGRGVAAVAGFGPEQSRTAVPGQAAYELLFWKKE